MKFSNNEIATYLFCAQLAQTKTTPLTIIEWNTVVKSLSEQEMQPEILFKINSKELFTLLTQATEAQKDRIIKKVIARQKLGLSMIELQEIVNQGYGIMFRSQMPARLKKLTQKFLPSFFYYAGDPSILLGSTMGVVGARDANETELLKTVEVAKESALNGIVIISGGARGIDTTAVEANLKNGGKAVIFPAEGLAKWVKKSTIRDYILNGKLLLMSTQRLNASFTGHYAMQRNKYIHAPSDALLIASSKISGQKLSGTWEGVLENLKYKWSPLFVIGSSEGVVKLEYEGKARRFSSIKEIYNEKNNEFINSADLEDELAQLVKKFVSLGLDKESLTKKFMEVSALYYKENINSKVNEERNLTKNALKYEQLKLD
ncbi:DNA-processing protein DprA [Alkalicoccobacillus murimartini]|uniref:Rossmann fold nucleotide-binding protein DprA/Smf involved in DNA uptake n=1 Tax=Alkalicoccobacillus murimartini TaxID=171685 RepID=A0ABT9YBL2_9BACI|nr:DNA-processing protein DprA [Alkalicoccobacillus murimartini]MDQ0205233.1 putative Rossmann fold nucleotide-binding protein DprA/Smf involved in DNA uptake [Alkalicoccobacillus murimartini]